MRARQLVWSAYARRKAQPALATLKLAMRRDEARHEPGKLNRIPEVAREYEKGMQKARHRIEKDE